MSAICYTLYSKDSFYNTLQKAIIKSTAVVKEEYMHLNHARPRSFP